MLEVIVLPGVLVVSPQFEMQFFVPGQPEKVYINNEAPSLLFMPSIFFQHEPPNQANMFSIVYIIAYLKNVFHCHFSSIWTLNPIYKVCFCPMMSTFVFF